MKKTSQLCEIARSGGSLVIKATNKKTAQLCEIARSLEGGTLTITEASGKKTAQLCEIARCNPGKITFDFN